MIQKDVQIMSEQTVPTSMPNNSDKHFLTMASRSTSSGTSFGQQTPTYILPIMPYQLLPSFPIGDWASWAMMPHTTEEIRKRLITKPIDDTCITYLCRFSKIAPDFFEEFAVLTSGLFHAPETEDINMRITQPVTYTKEAVDYYIAIFKSIHLKEAKPDTVPKSIKKDINRFKHYTSAIRRDKKFPSLVTIADRLDWFYLKQYQCWPAWLAARYYNQLQAGKLECVTSGLLAEDNTDSDDQTIKY